VAFGVYIHIPYCIQRCSYCDFATYEQSQIMPPEKYFKLLLSELSQKASAFKNKKLDTIYFGGGTPSLVSAPLIVSVLEELSRHGFTLDYWPGRGPRKQTEITIEINPATVSKEKLDLYLKSGINRFSVGAQTFNDEHLKFIGRKHNSLETKETLDLLKANNLNFSFDIIFALPHQTLNDLRRDLDEILIRRPNHISPYCLTVPESHPLAKNRPLEEDQLEMFKMIESTLIQAGYIQYEISNFCLPGFESKHNSLYWDDENYWGLGLGAHSYQKQGEWGLRYWNPNAINDYEKLILTGVNKNFDSPELNLPIENFEQLKKHQALTDFCHTSLRRQRGLSKVALIEKFGTQVAEKLQGPLSKIVSDGLLNYSTDLQSWSLTSEGKVLSNQVFAALTFLKGEV
jgi:oxygen-independent coproporphyrinogen-3 oxidase